MILALLCISNALLQCTAASPLPASPVSGWASPSTRGAAVPSFKVMDVVAAAAAMEATGRPVLHLEVGQPFSGAPPEVCEAAAAALERERLGYTVAQGLLSLRKAIVAHYEQKEGIGAGSLSPERVLVTTGSSGGFLLVFNACFDVGDTVAVGMTCYPCYRNILHAMGVRTASLPLNHEYKVTAHELELEIKRRAAQGLPKLKGLIQSTPANPTGAMLTAQETRELCTLCRREGIWYISDELYHGISFEAEEASALRFDDAQGTTIVVNSFSKYYSMTGWRLGWLVLPDALVGAATRLQQNLFINAPTLSQVAAEACFTPSTDALLQNHVARYKTNKDVLLAGLATAGIDKAQISPAHGAFYLYVDFGDDSGGDLVEQGYGSEALCARFLLDEAVALTPGTDFEDPEEGRGPYRVRFSFPGATADVAAAMERFVKWWPSWKAEVQEARESQAWREELAK